MRRWFVVPGPPVPVQPSSATTVFSGALASGAVFTSEPFDFEPPPPAVQWTDVTVSVAADGDDVTVVLEVSPDATDWTTEDTLELAEVGGQFIATATYEPTTRWGRIVTTNGSWPVELTITLEASL